MTKKNMQVENEATLSNKRIALLGGSSGIGLAVAQQVVKQGAHPVIASSNAERVQKAVASVGGKAEGYTLDLSDEASIELFFRKLGVFDHLVYTAGDTLQLKELGAMDLKKAREAFELRFWSALAAVKYATPNINQGGSIVLTTGIAGVRPHKAWTVAAAGCGALVSLTRALAVELAPIRVNAVSPGVVRTNLWQTCRTVTGRPCSRGWESHSSLAAWVRRRKSHGPIYSLCKRVIAPARLSWLTAVDCWCEGEKERD